jgi:SAM-dependent methyltransferase
MAMAEEADMGSAQVQGELWGHAPQDWAEVVEPLLRPLSEATLAALAPLQGRTFLDAGCGAGGTLSLAQDAGARVSGLDASGPLLEVARGRVPDADLRVGDIQEMPYDDGTFDVVTAFNAIQYAADPKAAVTELARVVRPGGQVAIGVWGEPSRCETEVLFDALRRLAPPPPDAPAPLAVSAPGVVEELLAGAGLAVTGSGEVEVPFVYPDLHTGWRGQSAAGPLRRVIDLVGEGPVLTAFEDVHRPFRQGDGTYRQDNVFRFVVARSR